MRTTLDIEDDVLQAAKELAQREGRRGAPGDFHSWRGAGWRSSRHEPETEASFGSARRRAGAAVAARGGDAGARPAVAERYVGGCCFWLDYVLLEPSGVVS